MNRLVLAVLLVAAAGRSDPRARDLSAIVRNVDRRFARRLFVLAQTAEAAKLPATARDLRRQVLVLQPEHRRARARLGYRREAGHWVRDGATAEAQRALTDGLAPVKPTKKPANEMAEDGDAARRRARDALLAEAANLEQKRVAEIVRVAVRYGTTAARGRVLEPLVRRYPQRADLHEALGHERAGAGWVRPALKDLASRMPAAVRAWREIGQAPVTLDLGAAPPALPGLDPKAGNIAVLGCGARVVVTTLGAEHAAPLARLTERTQRFVRHTLGRGAGWDPTPIAFLAAPEYTALVRALHKDDREFALYHRFDNYEHKDFYAIRCLAPVSGVERYAHGAGHFVAYERAAPDKADGSRDARAYAWWREGYGYFVSLELVDRGYLDFISLHESTGKRRFTRPPPAQRTRVECWRWLREQVAAGRSHPLRSVCGMSLNALDFCAAMQAYSFVRFLVLYDPDAFRALPGALRKRTVGAPLARTDAALKEAFEKGLDELEPLWRAFVVELAPVVE